MGWSRSSNSMPRTSTACRSRWPAGPNERARKASRRDGCARVTTIRLNIGGLLEGSAARAADGGVLEHADAFQLPDPLEGLRAGRAADDVAAPAMVDGDRTVRGIHLDARGLEQQTGPGHVHRLSRPV